MTERIDVKIAKDRDLTYTTIVWCYSCCTKTEHSIKAKAGGKTISVCLRCGEAK